MKKYLFIIILLGSVCTISCRKDLSGFIKSPDSDSTFVTDTTIVVGGGSNPSDSTVVSGPGTKCLILKEVDTDIDAFTEFTYQSDSVIASKIMDGYIFEVRPEIYLHKETQRKYLVYDGDNDVEETSYRIYLNSFGAVEREVEAYYDSFTKKIEENPTSGEVKYFYNSKKQLVKMESNLFSEKFTWTIEYDSKNRVSKILAKDQKGANTKQYNNFKYSADIKQDNLSQLNLTATMGSYFIPSLRNVYISEYTFFDYNNISSDVGFYYGYKFTFNNKVLAKSKNTSGISAVGQVAPLSESNLEYTLKCK